MARTHGLNGTFQDDVGSKVVVCHVNPTHKSKNGSPWNIEHVNLSKLRKVVCLFCL
jgi:hypothetical protein